MRHLGCTLVAAAAAGILLGSQAAVAQPASAPPAEPGVDAEVRDLDALEGFLDRMDVIEAPRPARPSDTELAALRRRLRPSEGSSNVVYYFRPRYGDMPVAASGRDAADAFCWVAGHEGAAFWSQTDTPAAALDALTGEPTNARALMQVLCWRPRPAAASSRR